MSIGTSIFACFVTTCFVVLTLAGHITVAGAAVGGVAAGLMIGFIASVA